MEVTEQSLYDDFEVQSLFYRAPELLVGKEFTDAIDMWYVLPFEHVTD